MKRAAALPLRRAALLVVFLIGLVLMPGPPPAAQTADLPTEEWTASAERAVSLLANSSIQSDALEEIRSELSRQRSEALAAQDRLRARVETIEAELGTLGPAPEEGTTEAPEIAEKRAELDARIAEARTPLLEAQVAYERADGLISEIDTVVRGRLSEELTALGPSPANPIHWPKAVADLQRVALRLQREATATLSAPFERGQFLGRLPFAGILILLALALQMVLRPRLMRSLQSSEDPLSRRIGVPLARNLLPAGALLLFVLGIDQIDLNPMDSVSPADVLFPMIVIVIVAYWVSNAVFVSEPVTEALDYAAQKRPRRARRAALLVALVLALMFLVRFLAAQYAVSDGTLAILLFPLFVLGGLFLARLSRYLGPAPSDPEEPSAEEEDLPEIPAGKGVRSFLARVGYIVAVLAPLLALIGYLPAATALFAPTVYTFALLGAFVAIYVSFRDTVDHWLAAEPGSKEARARSRYRSIPLLGGLFLTCLAVPLLALIWGARVSELEEVWVWLRDGMTIGDVRLSVTDLLTFVLIFGVGYTITRGVQTVVRGSVLPRMDFDRGAANAIVSGIGYVGIFVSALIAISATGLSLSNVAIVAGALSVGIGFGLQTIVSNFVSGIILLVERPIKEGDWIEVAGYSGYVRKISVRSTRIDTFDRASVIVPNSELVAGTVLNWTHGSMMGRVIVPVGVAYGEDPRKVEAILLAIAEAHPMVLRRPPPTVVFQGFGADSLDFEIRAFLRDVNWMLTAKSEMNFEIARRFEEEGVEIPYAQRDINLRNVDAAARAFWKGKQEAES